MNNEKKEEITDVQINSIQSSTKEYKIKSIFLFLKLQQQKVSFFLIKIKTWLKKKNIIAQKNQIKIRTENIEKFDKPTGYNNEMLDFFYTGTIEIMVYRWTHLVPLLRTHIVAFFKD